MKKIALAAVAAAALAAPVSAQQANDPFVATQGAGLSALAGGAGAAVVAGAFLLITVVAASNTD